MVLSRLNDSEQVERGPVETVQPALQKNIPIHIKNTFASTDKGTFITKKSKDKKEPVKGISHIENIALLTLEGNGMIGVPGFSKRLFSALSRSNINVVLITQASSEHSICVGVYSADAKKAKQIVFLFWGPGGIFFSIFFRFFWGSGGALT